MENKNQNEMRVEATQEKAYMTKVRKQVREFQKPYVMKDEQGSLCIIYEGRVEYYEKKKRAKEYMVQIRGMFPAPFLTLKK